MLPRIELGPTAYETEAGFGYEFLDRFGSRYRVTGIDEDEGYIEVELVEAIGAIELTEYLAHHRLTHEETRQRVDAVV